MEWASGAARPLTLRFGLYDLNSEFDMSDSRSLFIHSTHGVGHDLGQTGENGPSIFPNTSLGLRAAWEPGANWRLLAAVLDGVPGDPDDPTRVRIHLSGEEGALNVAEAQWSGARIGTLSIGHWRQPDIQYIFNPGADPAISDSLAFGLRVEISGSAAR